ncbi:hypothetical protein ACQKGL_30080 [Ensifer adhaerens]|uniref:hypothetical protein n=1 Tax=Ensifer adhaerens TaxID=106592 RepID=UPI003D0751FD
MFLSLLGAFRGVSDGYLTERFSQVYKDNTWGDSESVSGEGSRRDAPPVWEAIDALDRTVRKFRIRSLVDLPCGDFNWIPFILGVHRQLAYRGFDIVPQLVQRNRAMFPSHRFDVLDATSNVPPKADLIFSKDMVNHLTLVDVAKVLKNFKRSRSSYLLMSNNLGWDNIELPENVAGASRHLDAFAAPFHFPEALWNSGYLALWRLSDVDESPLDRIIAGEA